MPSRPTVIAVLALAACSPVGAASARVPARPSVPSPVRLRVLPAQASLVGPTARQQFLAQAVYADGSVADVTQQTKWSSTLPGSTLGPSGVAAAGRDGRGEVVARLGTLTARAALTARGVRGPVHYRFRSDVVPVLARIGCSQGMCHGANSGKGGFKLSLRGFAPELDFLTITRRSAGRLIAREAPERSLFLRKPLGEVPHGGGKVLTQGSREHATLLGWLREGAVDSDPTEPRLTGVRTDPVDRTYRPGQLQRLVVTAVYADGRTRDVTDRALFRTNDPGVASVTADGRVTAVSSGATAVMAKYGEYLASSVVTVPYPIKALGLPFPSPVNLVDKHVYDRLRQLGLDASPRCSDAEFLRRLWLDVAGTLPTAEDVRAFLADPNPNRREAAIEAALRRPEYASIWALRLCDVSMIRKEHLGRKNTLAVSQWLTEQFQNNRPWDKLVEDLVAATGDIEENPATLWWASRQATRPNARGWVRHYELTGEIVAQVFLGQRIQCTKCHNHPTESYTQDDYYHFAAIFAQVNGDGPADPVPQRFLANDAGEVRHPRTNELMIARPLDHSELGGSQSDDRRIAFAAWLRGGGQRFFAANIVNRIWARLFGSGIVDPVDDLRSTNPPRNAPLLSALSRSLIDSGWDLKRLIGLIVRSNTYQASATPTLRNAVDSQFGSHYPSRRLSAEELADAIAQVTGVPDRFASYPLGTRAIELSDTELNVQTLDVFGRPTRTTPCECDRSAAPSLSQALELLNGEALQAKLGAPDGLVSRLLRVGQPDQQLIAELFLTALSRPPTPKELADVRKLIAPSPNRTEALQDVLWALINTKEFMFHH